MSLTVTADSKPSFVEVDSLPILTFQEMEKMVRSIRVETITQISECISEQVFNRLNPLTVANIHLMASQEENDFFCAMAEIGSLNASMKSPLSSEEKKKAFLYHFTLLLKQEIFQALSVVGNFIDRGLVLRMTEYHPEEILAETLTKIDIELQMGDYPTKYLLYLRIDREETAKQKKLVLISIEESQGIEFAKTKLNIIP